LIHNLTKVENNKEEGRSSSSSNEEKPKRKFSNEKVVEYDDFFDDDHEGSSAMYIQKKYCICIGLRSFSFKYIFAFACEWECFKCLLNVHRCFSMKYILGDSNAENSTEYEIAVKTSDKTGAGTGMLNV